MSRPPPQNPFANPQQKYYDNANVNSERFYDQSGNFDPYCKCNDVDFGPMLNFHGPAQGRREPDLDSEADAYSQRYTPSSDNLMNTPRSSVPLVDPHASTQTFTSDYTGPGYGQPKEPYPAWTTERQIPLSKECVPLSVWSRRLLIRFTERLKIFSLISLRNSASSVIQCVTWYVASPAVWLYTDDVS